MTNYLKHILYKSQASFKTEGVSMLPIFKPGEELFFQKKKFNKIQVNDLVLFKQKTKLIVHRVVYKGLKFIVTKGDNNRHSDGRIYQQQVLAVVSKIKKGNSKIAPNTLYLIQSGHYLQEIIRIKKAFDQAALDYLFLKGLPLHLFYEKTNPKRIYADCDVLVKPKDVALAKRILIKHGYKQLQKSLLPWVKTGKKYEPEFVFTKNINGFWVNFDLHQELVFLMTDMGQLNTLYSQVKIRQLTNQALANKRLVRIRGERYFILNQVFLVLYLSLHLFHHNYRGASRYQFLETVIKAETRLGKFDWRQLRALIKQYQLANFTHLVFVYYNQYFGPRFPKSFLTATKPNSLCFRLLSRFQIDIFSDQDRLRGGMWRFMLLFCLSPRSLLFRLMTFVNPLIILMVLFSLQQYFFSRQLFKQRH